MITQEKDTVDPKIIHQLNAKYKNYDEAFNINDAAAMGAFFTEDAVLVSDRGPISGREAIEKYYADLFKQFHCSNHIGKPDQYSPHIIGTAGNEVWSSGEWSLTLQGETGDPIPIKGYWSEIYVREGDAWKVRMQTWNMTPAETK
jgi:ketosteroid isomerase-like protein